jgi:hypothetical protein
LADLRQGKAILPERGVSGSSPAVSRFAKDEGRLLSALFSTAPPATSGYVCGWSRHIFVKDEHTAGRGPFRFFPFCSKFGRERKLGPLGRAFPRLMKKDSIPPGLRPGGT